jgi:D-sedoheptulose 7-phosphate isomerase
VRYLSELAALLAAVPEHEVAAAEELLWETYARDGTVIALGNGGSAATASHFASDLLKWTIAPGRRRVRAIALTDNVAAITAWSNDAAYERAFAEQVASLARPGDVVVALSCSGESASVLRAVEQASEQGAATIGLCGATGGALARAVDVAVVVAHDFLPQVEDVHLALCHGLAVGLGERIERTPA